MAAEVNGGDPTAEPHGDVAEVEATCACRAPWHGGLGQKLAGAIEAMD